MRIQRRDAEGAKGSQRSGVRSRRSAKEINRRFTPINVDKDWEILPQRAQREARDQVIQSDFCLSGEADKQKHVSIADDSRIKILKNLLNRRFTQIYTD